MHGNSNFERNQRTKERNARPPRGNEQQQRGKDWVRGNKRDQWTPAPVTELFR